MSQLWAEITMATVNTLVLSVLLGTGFVCLLFLIGFLVDLYAIFS